MKIAKKILFGIVGLVLLVLIVALFIRRDYAVEREIVINKPKQEVFDYIKLLKNQNNYSVWAQTDPNMKKEYKGVDGTVGFISAWDSDMKNVGKGEQEIKSISEGERLDFELRFKKPFEATDNAFMTTDAVGENRTKVKWGFDGKMPYPRNIMLPFLNMEKMLGKDLEEGLKNLKNTLEK